jgi:exopolyphosphatase/guanosine-5'-triphosphate,3'-diphosphate pyrophosphatase
MIRSTIDIGTNTILLLIAEYENGSIKTILDIQRVPRLGKGVDANRNILPASVDKAVEILSEYRKLSEEHGSTGITATATSFIRDSANKQEFIDTIESKTGIKIEILSGGDEAKNTFIGGVYDKLSHAHGRITTIDIGGGSTEITSANRSAEKMAELFDLDLTGKSMNIGSVRINEKYLNQHPASPEKIKQAEDFVNEHLKQIDFDIAGTKLIGVAGTVTTLAAVKLGLKKYDAAKVDNVVITIKEISAILSGLIPLSISELQNIGEYMEGRADIIIPGILILKCFMEKFGFEDITISTKGLRYGIFLRDIMKQTL